MYKILPYSKRKAKALNLIIKPSTRRGKKIDIFNKYGEYITSIGDSDYLDFPTYLKYFGKIIADKKRKAYKIRHNKDRKIKYSRGWYADQILW